MTAATNSAVERSSTRRTIQMAGTTVRYGRIANPTTIQATTQAARKAPRVRHVAEQLAPIDLDRREREADQAAEGGPKDPDIADQRFPRRARRPRTTIGTGGRSA